MGDDEELYNLALAILCEVRALKECDHHCGTFFDGGGDVADAYRLANARVTSGGIALAPGKTRRDLTDAIKRAYEENAALDACQECERNFSPD